MYPLLMRVKVRYCENLLAYALGPGRSYTFEVPKGTQVGDLFRDGDNTVEVVELGSEYPGPVRQLLHRVKR
jgi:hypothetical protein